MINKVELDYSQICTVKDCSRHQTTKMGLCQSHYQMYRTLLAQGLTDKEARLNLDSKVRRYKSNSKKPCNVENCTRPHYSKGMCRVHYARAIRNSTKVD